MFEAEPSNEDCPEFGRPYQHSRSALVHRAQTGFASSHLIRLFLHVELKWRAGR